MSDNLNVNIQEYIQASDPVTVLQNCVNTKNSDLLKILLSLDEAGIPRYPQFINALAVDPVKILIIAIKPLHECCFEVLLSVNPNGSPKYPVMHDILARNFLQICARSPSAHSLGLLLCSKFANDAPLYPGISAILANKAWDILELACKNWSYQALIVLLFQDDYPNKDKIMAAFFNNTLKVLQILFTEHEREDEHFDQDDFFRELLSDTADGSAKYPTVIAALSNNTWELLQIILKAHKNYELLITLLSAKAPNGQPKYPQIIAALACHAAEALQLILSSSEEGSTQNLYLLTEVLSLFEPQIIITVSQYAWEILKVVLSEPENDGCGCDENAKILAILLSEKANGLANYPGIVEAISEHALEVLNLVLNNTECGYELLKILLSEKLAAEESLVAASPQNIAKYPAIVAALSNHVWDDLVDAYNEEPSNKIQQSGNFLYILESLLAKNIDGTDKYPAVIAGLKNNLDVIEIIFDFFTDDRNDTQESFECLRLVLAADLNGVSKYYDTSADFIRKSFKNLFALLANNYVNIVTVIKINKNVVCGSGYIFKKNNSYMFFAEFVSGFKSLFIAPNKFLNYAVDDFNEFFSMFDAITNRMISVASVQFLTILIENFKAIPLGSYAARELNLFTTTLQKYCQNLAKKYSIYLNNQYSTELYHDFTLQLLDANKYYMVRDAIVYKIVFVDYCSNVTDYCIEHAVLDKQIALVAQQRPDITNAGEIATIAIQQLKGYPALPNPDDLTDAVQHFCTTVNNLFLANCKLLPFHHTLPKFVRHYGSDQQRIELVNHIIPDYSENSNSDFKAIIAEYITDGGNFIWQAHKHAEAIKIASRASDPQKVSAKRTATAANLW